ENDQGWVPFGTLKLLAKGASGKTMEFAYNDFCVAQVAGLLGLKEDRCRFGARSERWSELWNAETESRGFKGFIQSRGKDGKWVPTEPYRAGIHPFCEHFYECDSWTYSLFVPHQAERLIELCGGPETFVARLANFGDVNGMENEPHFLLPYLFIYASRPDLTPTYTKKIRSRFNNGNTPGEEDSGAMSSWYLFTTMGFFPNAGQDVYLVNGPRYRKLTLQMEGGKKLIVEAGNAGPNNIHVRSLSINDKPWNQAWFTHDLIANGGKLTFVMSDQPTDWARTAPVPPSYRFAPAGSVSTAPPTATKEEGGAVKPLPAEETAAPIFRIGKPDGSAMEFALADKGAACESAYSNAFPKPVVVTVGPGDASSWPFIHPGSKDVWAGATSHVYTIRFNANAPVPRKLKLVLGLISTWQQSRVTVTVNGNPAVEQLLPDHNSQGGRITTSGATRPFEILLPDGAVQPGENTLTIGLSGGSWMVYDYVLLTERLPITISMQNPVHKMAGGIGASWHAVRKVLPGTMRGIAYGGNPPLENTKAWSRLAGTPSGWDSTGYASSSIRACTSRSETRSTGTTRRCGRCTAFSTGARRIAWTCS
ncbi:MAG: glycoside hydrolase domain-containing protein, partial [bacterium]